MAPLSYISEPEGEASGVCWNESDAELSGMTAASLPLLLVVPALVGGLYRPLEEGYASDLQEPLAAESRQVSDRRPFAIVWPRFETSGPRILPPELRQPPPESRHFSSYPVAGYAEDVRQPLGSGALLEKRMSLAELLYTRLNDKNRLKPLQALESLPVGIIRHIAKAVLPDFPKPRRYPEKPTPQEQFLPSTSDQSYPPVTVALEETEPYAAEENILPLDVLQGPVRDYTPIDQAVHSSRIFVGPYKGRKRTPHDPDPAPPRFAPPPPPAPPVILGERRVEPLDTNRHWHKKQSSHTGDRANLIDNYDDIKELHRYNAINNYGKPEQEEEEGEHFGEQWTVMDFPVEQPTTPRPTWDPFGVQRNEDTSYWHSSTVHEEEEVVGDYSQLEIITAIPDWRLNDIEEGNAGYDDDEHQSQHTVLHVVDEGEQQHPQPDQKNEVRNERPAEQDMPNPQANDRDLEHEEQTALPLSEEENEVGVESGSDYETSDEITLEPEYFAESLRIPNNHLERSMGLELEERGGRGPKYISSEQGNRFLLRSNAATRQETDRTVDTGSRNVYKAWEQLSNSPAVGQVSKEDDLQVKAEEQLKDEGRLAAKVAPMTTEDVREHRQQTMGADGSGQLQQTLAADGSGQLLVTSDAEKQLADRRRHVAVSVTHHVILNERNEKVGEIGIESLLLPHEGLGEEAPLEMSKTDEESTTLIPEQVSVYENRDVTLELDQPGSATEMLTGEEQPLDQQAIEDDPEQVLTVGPKEADQFVVEPPRPETADEEAEQPDRKTVEEQSADQHTTATNQEFTIELGAQKQEENQHKDLISTLAPDSVTLLSTKGEEERHSTEASRKVSNERREPIPEPMPVPGHVPDSSKAPAVDRQMRGERIYLPAGHGLQFGLTLGHLDKAEKMKLDIFSKSSLLASRDI